LSGKPGNIHLGGNIMAARKLFINTPVFKTTVEGFAPAAVVAAASLPAGHRTPNLAAALLAVRTASKLSQMQLGTNRRAGVAITDGLRTPAQLLSSDKAHLKSGWFSVIANVEQGGRKLPVPEAFVAYVADVLGHADTALVVAAIAEDAKLAEAAVKANTPKA
jgi:hypothetical protein